MSGSGSKPSTVGCSVVWDRPDSGRRLLTRKFRRRFLRCRRRPIGELGAPCRVRERRLDESEHVGVLEDTVAAALAHLSEARLRRSERHPG